jgi:hypothetical protein
VHEQAVRAGSCRVSRPRRAQRCTDNRVSAGPGLWDETFRRRQA